MVTQQTENNKGDAEFPDFSQQLSFFDVNCTLNIVFFVVVILMTSHDRVLSLRCRMLLITKQHARKEPSSREKVTLCSQVTLCVTNAIVTAEFLVMCSLLQGVDEEYDASMAEVRSAEANLDGVLQKQRQRLGCQVRDILREEYQEARR